jgi:hypothetical protein
LEKTEKQIAEELRHEIISAARRRNAAHQDIEAQSEFEQFVGCLEDIGAVTERWATQHVPPLLGGRALQYYAKAIAAVHT